MLWWNSISLNPRQILWPFELESLLFSSLKAAGTFVIFLRTLTVSCLIRGNHISKHSNRHPPCTNLQTLYQLISFIIFFMCFLIRGISCCRHICFSFAECLLIVSSQTAAACWSPVPTRILLLTKTSSQQCQTLYMAPTLIPLFQLFSAPRCHSLEFWWE